MEHPPFEVADVFRMHAASYLEAYPTSPRQHAVMRAIINCRTAALGGHLEQCDRCGHQRNAYNSCRDRHCPKCQALARERWLEARKADLLPVEYFHVVFTVPSTIADVALQNQKLVYDILFAAASHALRRVAANPDHLGAEIGYLAVLHTWGQNLQHHPHVHCVVTGGGLSPDGQRWMKARKGFFLPVRVLSRLFRALFLRAMRRAYTARKFHFAGTLEHLHDPAAFASWLNLHWKSEWVVYSKRPFGGPERVMAYLGRYTHRIAISNHRLLNVTHDKVTFRWKDYRSGNGQRAMTLHPHEFMRRFLLHVLPRHFVRLRHGGFLANRYRKAKLAHCRELLRVPAPPPQPHRPLDWKERYELLTGQPIDRCPVCKLGRMVIAAIYQGIPPSARSPPRTSRPLPPIAG